MTKTRSQSRTEKASSLSEIDQIPPPGTGLIHSPPRAVRSDGEIQRDGDMEINTAGLASGTTKTTPIGKGARKKITPMIILRDRTFFKQLKEGVITSEELNCLKEYIESDVDAVGIIYETGILPELYALLYEHYPRSSVVSTIENFFIKTKLAESNSQTNKNSQVPNQSFEFPINSQTSNQHPPIPINSNTQKGSQIPNQNFEIPTDYQDSRQNFENIMQTLSQGFEISTNSQTPIQTNSQNRTQKNSQNSENPSQTNLQTTHKNQQNQNLFESQIKSNQTQPLISQNVLNEIDPEKLTNLFKQFLIATNSQILNLQENTNSQNFQNQSNSQSQTKKKFVENLNNPSVEKTNVSEIAQYITNSKITNWPKTMESSPNIDPAAHLPTTSPFPVNWHRITGTTPAQYIVTQGTTVTLQDALSAIPDFEGDPNIFEPFAEGCEEAKNMVDSTMEQNLTKLIRNKLHGPAKQSIQGRQFTNITSLIQFLRNLFAPTESLAQLQGKLGRLIQENYEPVVVFGNRARQLMLSILNAYSRNGGNQTSFRFDTEQETIRCFIRGLKKGIRVSQHRCIDLDTAIREAIESEKEKQARDELRGIEDPKNQHFIKKGNNAPQFKHNPRINAAMLEVCSYCQKPYHTEEKCWAKNGYPPKICSYCKNKGHTIQECRKKKYRDEQIRNETIQQGNENRPSVTGAQHEEKAIHCATTTNQIYDQATIYTI